MIIILWFSFYSLCRFLGSSVLTYSSFSLVPFSLHPNTQSIDLVVVMEKEIRLHLTSLLFYTNSLSYFHQYLTLLIHPNTIVRVPLTSSSSKHQSQINFRKSFYDTEDNQLVFYSFYYKLKNHSDVP